MANRPQLKDWNSIKKSFLQGMTYAEMSKRYDVAKSTICARAKKERWEDLMKFTRAETDRKIAENVSDRNARIAKKVTEGAELCVDKCLTGIKTTSSKNYTALRTYMAILKDAKEMGIYRSDMDTAEQMARIKKLEKEASAEEQDNTINVVISSEVEEYAD